MTAGEIVYKITGDASGLNKSLQQTQTGLKGATKGFKAFDAALKASVIIAIVAAAKKLAEFAGVLVDAGSEAEEVANKFNAVFSTIKGEATESVQALAAAYNLSNVEAQKLVGNTADILTGLGTTQDAALETSLSVNALAADLASFNNIPVAQASEAITKALLGEREAIKTLGIAIGEEDVKQRLLAEGKENLTGLSLRQAKAEATLALALEQSKNAIGDVERSSDSLANKRKELAAQTENLKALLGSYLQGPAKQIVQNQIDFRKATIEAINATDEFITSLVNSERGQVALAAISFFAEKAGEGLIKARDAIVKFITAAKDKVFETIGNAIEKVVGKFEDLTGASEKALNPLTVVTTVFAGLGNVIKLSGQILGAFLQIFVDLGRAVKQAGGSIVAFFKAISGQLSFSEFKNELGDIGGAFKNLGSNANENLNSIKTNFSTFTERTKKDAQRYKNSILGIVEQNKNAKDSSEDLKDTIDETGDAINETGKEAKTFGEKLKDAFDSATWEDWANAASNALSSTSEIISAFGALQQAQYDAQLSRLDEQLQKELENAGVAEETKTEQYQRELDEAIAAGDAEAEAEAKKNLKRAKIEEKYQKKKAELEYKAAVANWEIQKTLAGIQLVQAPLNAFVGSVGALPGPLGFALATAAAIAAATAAGLQYQAVVESKPQKNFALGGIVPGSSFSGDNVNVNTNSGEMILNDKQQGELFKLANGQGTGNNLRPVVIDNSTLWDQIFKASRNGQLFIDKRALAI